MDVFCARCSEVVRDADESLFAQGTCPQCAGQLAIQRVKHHDAPRGAVAMSFGPGSRVGVPLEPHFRAANLNGSGAQPPAPPVELDTQAKQVLGHEEEELPDDIGRRTTEFDFDPPSASADVNPKEFDAGESRSITVPAELKPPSINYSPSTDRPKADPVDLPAHLKLPNFPDFKLPPIPGEEDDGMTLESVSSGSFEGEAPPQPPSRPPEPADDEWSVSTKNDAPLAPPPLPPTAKRSDTLPDLPEMGLSAAPQQEQSKEPTLLNKNVADSLGEVSTKRGWAGVAMVGALVLVVIGVAVWQHERITAAVAGDDPIEVATSRDKARKKFVAGQSAYEEKKYKQALELFGEALEIDKTYGEAHRGMAIAYAGRKQMQKAYEHYRAYLQLEPDADDAADVKKIVEAYEKKHKKK